MLKCSFYWNSIGFLFLTLRSLDNELLDLFMLYIELLAILFDTIEADWVSSGLDVYIINFGLFNFNLFAYFFMLLCYYVNKYNSTLLLSVWYLKFYFDY